VDFFERLLGHPVHAMKNITEKVFRRLLREASVGTGNQAAFVEDLGDLKRAIIYDKSLLLRDVEYVKRSLEEKGKEFLVPFFHDIMLAFIEITPPESAGGNPYGPCAGAWMVSAVAGPGYRDTIYGLGYALSPNGLLVPDRSSVKPRARNAWKRDAASGRERIQLDDREHDHEEPGNEYHTDDPSDDCKLHMDLDDPQLDFAYRASGSEVALLNSLTANHDDTMNQLGDLYLIADVENLLTKAVAPFWNKHYFGG
jgi:hypothetical protein